MWLFGFNLYNIIILLCLDYCHVVSDLNVRYCNNERPTLKTPDFEVWVSQMHLKAAYITFPKYVELFIWIVIVQNNNFNSFGHNKTRTESIRCHILTFTYLHSLLMFIFCPLLLFNPENLSLPWTSHVLRQMKPLLKFGLQAHSNL